MSIRWHWLLLLKTMICCWPWRPGHQGQSNFLPQSWTAEQESHGAWKPSWWLWTMDEYFWKHEPQTTKYLFPKHLQPRRMAEVIVHNVTTKSDAQRGVQRAASPVRVSTSVFLEPLQIQLGTCNCPEVLVWSETSCLCISISFTL